MVYYPVLGIRYDIFHIVVFRISLIHWRVFAIMRSLQYNQCQDSMRHIKKQIDFSFCVTLCMIMILLQYTSLRLSLSLNGMYVDNDHTSEMACAYKERLTHKIKVNTYYCM